MGKTMKLIAFSTTAAALCTVLLYKLTSTGIFLTLAITFGTIAYHFCIRLIIGQIYNAVMKNKADYTKKWFQTGKFEQSLYKRLNVKKWKKNMPTYDSSLFDASVHSWQDIAQAMCQAELVHETIIPLSFLPIIAAIWFGALPVFVITSVLGALYDLLFVIMQRYNRPRIIKLIRKTQKEEKYAETEQY